MTGSGAPVTASKRRDARSCSTMTASNSSTSSRNRRNASSSPPISVCSRGMAVNKNNFDFDAIDSAPMRQKRSETLAFSDEVLAQVFIDRHVADLRYTALWGKWLIWDGCRWAPDDRLATFSLVRQLCYEQARQAESNEAKGIASAGTVAAIERLARADQRIAVTVDEWDADPWLLNTAGGTVDLRTGQMSESNFEDKLTKITGVSPDWSCATPLFDQLLLRATAGDMELIAFLRRMAGFSLTGSIQEHVLFFLYGTGANGKSTFLNAI